MNEEQRGEVIRRAEEAKELLKNELLASALSWMDTVGLQMVREANTPDEAYRAAVLSQMAVRFRAVLSAHIQNGEAVAASLLREQEILTKQRQDALRVREYMKDAENARKAWEEQISE